MGRVQNSPMPAFVSPTSPLSTKATRTRADLEALVRRQKPETKLPTVIQLAAELGVSKGTVHTALLELEREQLIQRRHGRGIYVAPTAQTSLVVICEPGIFRTTSRSPFWDLLTERIRERAESLSYRFSLHFALAPTQIEEDGVPLHSGIAAQIRSGEVGGVIGIGLQEPVWKWIEAHDVPFASFANWGKRCVGIDSAGKVRAGVTALWQQGCRRIGLWAPQPPYVARPTDIHSSSSVTDSLRVELEQRGLPFEAALVKDNSHLRPHEGAYTTESHQEQGYRTAHEVFDAVGPQPDGVVILDDLMAHGAFVALRRLGVEVGRDVQVAAHVNKDLNVLLGSERFTPIEIDVQQVIDALFQLLEAARSNEPMCRMLIQPSLLRPTPDG